MSGPPTLKRYPLAKSFAVADMSPKSFTAEELLAICRPAGVGRVNLIQMSYYEFDNAYMLDTIAKDPDRFVGTGIIDPLVEKPGEAMKALLPKGVRAFRIQPQYSQLPPCPLARADRLRVDVRHRRGNRPDPLVLDRARLVSRSRPDVSQVSRNLDDHRPPRPDRRRRRHPPRRRASPSARSAKHPRMHIKVGAFYALGKKTPPYLDLAPLIKAVVSAYGPKRCLWESDCPFQVVSHKYTDSLSLVRDHLDFLSDDDKDWLLRKTAEKILFERV